MANIDKYLNNQLGPQVTTLKSAYRLFDTDDQLESGWGWRAGKRGFYY